MDLASIDWSALERLRAGFLEGTAGGADYWQKESDLASYDATFAQRIGWKWDYVLTELERRGWTPPPGELLDWGCGSGIAHRAFLDYFGAESMKKVNVWDRSPLATRFASRRAKQKYPGLSVDVGLVEAPAILLVSHVLSELESEQAKQLIALASCSTAVLWIEPGNYDASRALITAREELRKHLNVVAPCTHAESCGMRAPGNERHWCHHFASPPREVFTDGDWARFANLAGVDLGKLPLSFLVLDRRPVPVLSANATRVIGAPRVYKPHALLFGCNRNGLADRKLSRRRFPAEYRLLRKGKWEALQDWESDGDELTAVRPLIPAHPGLSSL